MPEIIQQIERDGRIWTIQDVSWDEAEEESFRFWYAMSPDDRVKPTEEALEICLRIRGLNGVPRLRRVNRIVKRKRRAVPDRGRAGAGKARASSRDGIS